jgi:hypothetical protein
MLEASKDRWKAYEQQHELARAEQERDRQEREMSREQQRELAQAKHERERQEREKALKRERQRRQNILDILNDDKLPEIDWSSLGLLPFKFQKTEHLIYVFPSVGYAEQRVRREIIGRSAGTSVRVMKGVSVRVGASRGTPVERDELVDRGRGIMVITSKHLYFNGQRSFRIPFGKIVSVQPMADAVEVTRDRASALAEYFVVGERDADFAFELLHSVPSLDLPRDPEKHDPADYHLLMLPSDVGDDELTE